MEKYSGIEVVAKRGDEPSDKEGASKALKKFFEEAQLVEVGDYTRSEYEVSVPEGFSSLFKSIKIEVNWHSPEFARIGWSYEHPGGGHNGLDIGIIVFEKDKQKWGWRINSTGKNGYID